jgi:hypothetical protein
MSKRQADLERLERYDSLTNDYLLAIITDEDRAAQVELEDGRLALGLHACAMTGSNVALTAMLAR